MEINFRGNTLHNYGNASKIEDLTCCHGLGVGSAMIVYVFNYLFSSTFSDIFYFFWFHLLGCMIYSVEWTIFRLVFSLFDRTSFVNNLGLILYLYRMSACRLSELLFLILPLPARWGKLIFVRLDMYRLTAWEFLWGWNIPCFSIFCEVCSERTLWVVRANISQKSHYFLRVNINCWVLTHTRDPPIPV